LKTYEYSEAEETLFGILSIQDKNTLARELSKLSIKYTDANHSWNIKSLDIKISKDANKFAIKIGNET